MGVMNLCPEFEIISSYQVAINNFVPRTKEQSKPRLVQSSSHLLELLLDKLLIPPTITPSMVIDIPLLSSPSALLGHATPAISTPEDDQ